MNIVSLSKDDFVFEKRTPLSLVRVTDSVRMEYGRVRHYTENVQVLKISVVGTYTMELLV